MTSLLAMPKLGTFAVFPTELRLHVFEKVDPADLYALSLTCSEFKDQIKGNRSLHRAICLAHWDEPPSKPNALGYEWIENLHDFVRMTKILESDMTIEEKTQHLEFVTESISKLMYTAESDHKNKSKTVELLTYLFGYEKNREAFLCNSNIYARARRELKPANIVPDKSFEERQLSAKLHCIYGVPLVLPKRSRFNSPYPFACSVVYDLRNYTAANLWGPYKGDGLATVDWERMEAVMIILGYNLRKFTENTHGVFRPLWTTPWKGASPDSFDPIVMNKLLKEPAPPVDAMDPYNVSGTWMRIVCFLDFSDLFAYNFNGPPPAANEPRQPIDTNEAIRLIIMEISITKITEPEENDGKELPVVHFKGTSRSMHAHWDPNANSILTGTVRMTREGEVRWRSLSSYQGEARWASEGIQIGGAKSSRGVLGHWFDKDHDPHGPAGPTAFWKISNEIDERPAHEDDLDSDGEEYEIEADDEEESELEIQVEVDGEEGANGPLQLPEGAHLDSQTLLQLLVQTQPGFLDTT